MVIWARRHYEALGTPARRLTVVYVGVFGAHRFHSLDSRHGPLLAPSSVSRQNISHVYPFLGQMVNYREGLCTDDLPLNYPHSLKILQSPRQSPSV